MLVIVLPAHRHNPSDNKQLKARLTAWFACQNTFLLTLLLMLREELLTALDKASPGTSYGSCDERTIVSPLNKTEAVETNFSRAQAGAGS